ncbi:hypothetical protein F2P81_021959 [Scophthalmus maximus]|uniref:HTH OST-type domain-containing protein n=1 Tax=Scophthalmus maximus TaxID=52904 RepID=A0A6A4RYU2_SCOMX|nr:hypothetical protein F2P81_021959 [Scophthalmus maximus]
MEKVLENIVAMVKQHQAGIPLKKLAVFYGQTYHSNLTLSSLGFDSTTSLVASLDRDLVVERELVFYKTRHHVRRAKEESNREEVLENIVAMVKQHQAGIPLKKLAVFYGQTYHSNLTLSSLGFDSTASLVSSLDGHLVVEKELVFHKDHHCGSQAGAGAGAVTSAKATEDSEMVLKNIVVMMKEHPPGIPLKRVAIVYNQKYCHQLALAPLGFKTISSLVASLKGELVLIEEVVFHKIHQPQSQPRGGTSTEATEDSRSTTLQRTDSPVGDRSTTPTVTVPTVMEKYQLTAPSMEQLHTFYFRQFKEELPLEQYMSLYDSWESSGSKNLPTKAEPTAGPSTDILQTTPAATTRRPEKEQQLPAVTPSFLCDSEFPELGSDVKNKAQKGRVKDANPRASTVPVFKEAYHAQLREVLGANMRAVEALEEYGEDIARRRRRKRVIDQDTVNSLMEDVIREIAAEGELVTKEKVISRTCALMQVASLEAVQIKPWTIQALKNLQYLVREINMFIESTEAVTSICTLYELGQSLAGLKDKKRFEELNLGPLCKFPLVHRMFKIDSNTKDDDIHQIETIDILKQLRIFRRQQTKVKVDLAEFMKYLSDHYNCDSPYELGIRIHSVGLPISTLMKVSRGEFAVMVQAREVIQKELEEETQERLRKVKKSVLEPVQGAGSLFSTGNIELRKKYASMTAAEVVLAVFSSAEGVFSPRMTKAVQSFLLQVSGDRLATALFQLAICGGSLAVPQDLVPKDKSPKSTEQTKREDRPPTSLPSEAKVKQFLKDSLASQNSAITLAHIASLERKLTKHFQVKDFLSLEQGNFLEFLAKHIQLLQDTLGSTLILGTGSVAHVGSGFRPTKQDVFEFIKQCGDIPSTDPDELAHIESALRSHYSVRDSRDLGYGTLQTLAGLVQRLRGLTGGGPSQVYYESSLFAKHGKSRLAPLHQTGPMSREPEDSYVDS